MPTNGPWEGHDMGKPEHVPAHPTHQRDADHPGYEIQDVNVGGIITFLAGLSGFIIVFFIFCFFMGKVVNSALQKQDGAPTKNALDLTQPGIASKSQGRENLASNADLEQRQLQQMATAFPTPRLETDDGNQDTADLHAREDLLLNYYSTSADMQPGTIRIPIDRAMELIVQRGLGAPPATATAPKQLMAGESAPAIQAPLTSGFARTGFELETMEAREQKLEFSKAEK
jgi:hypothetical protein